MDASADLHEALARAGLDAVAPYAVAMAYRVRFYMEMNAREAMHVIELRTAPQGHPAYRRVCQQMHTLIADRAGHHGDRRRDEVRGSLRGGAGAAESGAGAARRKRRRQPKLDPDRRLLAVTFVPAPVAAELVQERQRLERLHPVEEQHAVEVIGLVLDHARREAARVDLDPLAAPIVGPHLDLPRARARGRGCRGC